MFSQEIQPITAAKKKALTKVFLSKFRPVKKAPKSSRTRDGDLRLAGFISSLESESLLICFCKVI